MRARGRGINRRRRRRRRREKRVAYETEGEDGAGRDGVHQHTDTEDVNVVCTGEQVPDEVTSCQTLQEAQSAIVAPDLAGPVHAVALSVVIHDPQSSRVDQQALDHRYNVYIPVDACAPVERVVCLREQVTRQGGRDDDVDGLVEDKGDDDLVNVQRQRG